MNITVIGAGATGGYFGARLADIGLNVTFLVRQNRANQLKTNGLVVKSIRGDITIKEPRIALSTDEIPECDVVLIGLKNYHLAASFPQLKDLVNRGAKLLPLLNGIEHFEILTKEFGEENVLGGLCKLVTTLDSEGTVHHTSKIHQLIFGELEPSSKELCLKLKQAMSQANLEAIYSDNIRTEIWNKYAFLSVFSGVTTAGNLTIDQIDKYDASRNVYRRSLEEMVILANANGVTLPNNFVEQNVKSLCKYQIGTTSSMHQDLRKGLPLEVESLQGAALRLADKVNIKIPTIEVLYDLIKAHE